MAVPLKEQAATHPSGADEGQPNRHYVLDDEILSPQNVASSPNGYCLQHDDRAARPERDWGFAVVDQLDYESYPGRRPSQRRRARVARLVLIVAALVTIAAASIYGWFNVGRLIPSASSAPGPVATAASASSEEMVGLKAFQSFQQQTAQSLQSIDQSVAAQKADLTRLSDQLADLAGRIDALQTAAAPAAAAPVRPAVTPPRRRLLVAAPAGPISVGGAPLPAAPAQDGR